MAISSQKNSSSVLNFNKLAKVAAILMIALVCLAFCQHSEAPVQNGENTLGNLQKDQIPAGLRVLSQAGYDRCIKIAQAEYTRCYKTDRGQCKVKYHQREKECASEHL